VKAAVLGRFGDNSEIRIAEVALPLLGDHDVLIRVHAASVNPVDVKTRQGKMQVLLKYQLPLVLGNDVAGTVTEVGARVTRFRKGDAVFARVDADRIGTFAEYVAVSENATARKPRNVTFEEAASLPLVALTAWQTLVDIGRIGPGQRVLVHAGSGGVGSIAIQLARHLGATVYTTVGARNVALVKQLGADVAIDYRQERFEEVASNCDVVLDSAGGDTLVRCFSAVKPSGVVVSINSNTPSPAFARAWGLNPFLVFAIRLLSRKVLAAARSRGARYEYCFVRADGNQLAQIADLVEQGVLRPVIDRIYPLAEVQEALAYSEAGRATGKVVVQVVASP
jgi:NADPH:quinone reductase-like Zn-dependent oxidoreductase